MSLRHEFEIETGRPERTRPNIFCDVEAVHFGFPVLESAGDAGLLDRRPPQRPPGLVGASIRTIKHFRAGGFGVDGRRARDRPDLLNEQRIVRYVPARLLREAKRVVELVSAGEANDLWQRLLTRPAYLRVPLC